jgi:hypothetical protein
MAWTINSIRIFVQESNAEASQILPRLQPISGGTVIQIFGYDSRVNTINAIVVGDTDRDALLALPTTGLSYALVSPEGSMGSYLVKKIAYKRIPNICQTMRPDLATDSPVYIFDVELYPV